MFSPHQTKHIPLHFLVPTFIVLFAVGFYPLMRTFFLGFTDYSFFTETSKFVGLYNFKQIISDNYWIKSLINTLEFTIISVFIEIVLGVIFAIVLNSQFAGRKFARAVNLIPFVIPLTVAAQLWKWMFHDVFGVINDLLMRIGIISQPNAWLDNPSTALLSIVAVAVWKFTPFVTLLVLAGLQSIPKELYESASIDGAGFFQSFRSITLPLLKGAILVALVFRVLDAIRVFDIVYVMTGNSHLTITVSMYARQQMIDFGNVGYGSAISVAIFFIVLVGTMIYMKLLNTEYY
ncbi:MAG: sugar ABC transporter permease [Candidatus Atribacteria bacterium]|nr:sugar ABC transporter permease [Candidatus Atribacteria bacterium]